MLSRTLSGSRVFLIGGGTLYPTLWVYGLVIDRDNDAHVVPLNPADNWLHLALGIGMISIGLALSRETESPSVVAPRPRRRRSAIDARTLGEAPSLCGEGPWSASMFAATRPLGPAPITTTASGISAHPQCARKLSRRAAPPDRPAAAGRVSASAFSRSSDLAFRSRMRPCPDAAFQTTHGSAARAHASASTPRAAPSPRSQKSHTSSTFPSGSSRYTDPSPPGMPHRAAEIEAEIPPGLGHRIELAGRRGQREAHMPPAAVAELVATGRPDATAGPRAARQPEPVVLL